MRIVLDNLSILVGCLVATLLSVSGCSHVRSSCSVSVDGGVHPIVTRNRYKALAVKFGDGVDATQGNLRSTTSNASLMKHQPGVFSNDGIPFVVKVKGGAAMNDYQHSSGGIVDVLSAITLTLVPNCISFEISGHGITLDVLDNPDARATYDLRFRHDKAMSLWTPLPLLCYIGEPANDDGWEHRSVVTRHSREFLFGDMPSEHDYAELREVVSAYAIASLLKKLEDDGLVDKSRSRDATRFTKQIGSWGDRLEIDYWNKDDEYGHRYSFTMRIRGGGRDSMRESMQEAIRTKIRDDYVASFPDVAARSLVVDFPEFSLRDGVITGRAIVLSLSVESLRYDPDTHTGMMRVRIGEGQFEDARRYARRNIEILVRDKNIALDAQTIPSAATFYTHDERLKGDVLEISFKTE